MKKQILYQCEYCGTQYTDAKDAEKCEKNHATPEKIVETRYTPISYDASGEPTMILVKLSNGLQVWFRR